MKAKQRNTLTAVALSCITSAGTTLVLVSLDGQGYRPASDPGQVDELRPPPAAAPEPFIAPNHHRFAFVRPDAFEFPGEPAQVAVSPESWWVEVKELPTSSSKLRQQNSRTLFDSANKAAGTPYTLKKRLAEISPTALHRLKAKFQSAEVAWPPGKIAFVAIKDEKALEVHARPENGAWKFVFRYRVLAASGASGPKIQRGDKQVPEGVYGISYLNPNSAYHLSLGINYPNAFDREMAAKDGRKNLGGDIMIHGKNVSSGCLAVGDESAEELFVLAAEVGIGNVTLVIAPTDFRRNSTVSLPKGPDWVPKPYTKIASAMAPYKAPPSAPSLLSLLEF